jgi:hypothetical protein
LKLEEMRMPALKQHGSRLHEFWISVVPGFSTYYHFDFINCVCTRSMLTDLSSISVLPSDKHGMCLKSFMFLTFHVHLSSSFTQCLQ